MGGEPVSLTLSRDAKLAFASVQDQDLISVISVDERKLLADSGLLPARDPTR